jgi:hypothetical protein
MTKRVFLGCTVVLLTWTLVNWGSAVDSIDPVAIVAEVDRIAGRQDLWPGFDPRLVPLVLYDGERTYLFHARNPFKGFKELPGRPGIFAHEGLHDAVRGNTATKFDGVAAAVVMLPGLGPAETTRLAALVIHEAFHVYQLGRHPKWIANEVELFTYPVHDPRMLALRHAEDEALIRAVKAGEKEEVRAWAWAALSLRRQRAGIMPAGAAQYERDLEILEGLAYYLQVRAAAQLEEVLPRPVRGFAPDQVRSRGYWSGVQLAFICDRLQPGWRETLEKNDKLRLEQMAFRDQAKPPADVRTFEPEELAGFRKQAEDDVNQLLEARKQSREEFLAAKGYRLEVQAAPGKPLNPRGFDPQNVKVLGGSDVLHLRYLRLGNSSGWVELLGRRGLTVGSGKHPLFPGVRSLTVTGLEQDPVVEKVGSGVRLAQEGLKLEFAKAAIERRGTTVFLRLR